MSFLRFGFKITHQLKKQQGLLNAIFRILISYQKKEIYILINNNFFIWNQCSSSLRNEIKIDY